MADAIDDPEHVVVDGEGEETGEQNEETGFAFAKAKAKAKTKEGKGKGMKPAPWKAKAKAKTKAMTAKQAEAKQPRVRMRLKGKRAQAEDEGGDDDEDQSGLDGKDLSGDDGEKHMDGGDQRQQGARKRPAAWHEVQVKSYVAPSMNSDDDMPDGEVDDRRVSRAQRYVFEAHLREVPEDVVKRYKELKDPNVKAPGKQRELNKILNAYVPRQTGWKGKLAPKRATVEQVIHKESRHTDRQSRIGMSETVFIGKVFNGHRELFDEAVAKGDVWQVGGKWYYSEEEERVDDIDSNFLKGNQIMDIEPTAFKSAMCQLMDLQPKMELEWRQVGGTDPSVMNKRGGKAMATDEDLMILQESFDSVTRVTSAIRAVAMAMRGGGFTSNSTAMAQRGIQLCREVVPSQNDVEQMLMQERTKITAEDVRTCLRNAAEPYRNLVTFYNELLAIYKLRNSSTASSSSGRVSQRFKPLIL